MKVYDNVGTYQCILEENSTDLRDLKESGLEADLQTFSGASTGKKFALKVSSDPNALDAELRYEPDNADYAEITIVTATMNLNMYLLLERTRGVTLRHSVGNLRIEIGSTKDLI
jgi:hypothetical protein